MALHSVVWNAFMKEPCTVYMEQPFHLSHQLLIAYFSKPAISNKVHVLID